MRRFPAFLALAFAAALAACAAKTTDGTTPAPRRDNTVMDTTELRAGSYSTVYDVISARHADWLMARGGPQGARQPELGVWIDGQVKTRGVDFLRSLRPQDIKQVKRLSTGESLHAYSWPWGGLVITLR